MGVPGLLGTSVNDREGRAHTRLAPSYIARMLAAFPTLVNGVDQRNVKAVRWIARMGFRLQAAAPAGPNGLPFLPFVMKA